MNRRCRMLCDRDVFVEIDVLNGLDEIDAFFEGALKDFAAHDHAHATGAFVGDGGIDGIELIGGSFAFAAAIDHPYATAIAVEHLVAGEVDRVVVGVCELGINERGSLAMFCSEIAAVIGG